MPGALNPNATSPTPVSDRDTLYYDANVGSKDHIAHAGPGVESTDTVTPNTASSYATASPNSPGADGQRNASHGGILTNGNGNTNTNMNMNTRQPRLTDPDSRVSSGYTADASDATETDMDGYGNGHGYGNANGNGATTANGAAVGRSATTGSRRSRNSGGGAARGIAFTNGANGHDAKAPSYTDTTDYAYTNDTKSAAGPGSGHGTGTNAGAAAAGAGLGAGVGGAMGRRSASPNREASLTSTGSISRRGAFNGGSALNSPDARREDDPSQHQRHATAESGLSQNMTKKINKAERKSWPPFESHGS